MTTIKTIYVAGNEARAVVKAVNRELHDRVIGRKDYMTLLAAVANGAAYCTIYLDGDGVPYKTRGYGNIALDNNYPIEPTSDEVHDQMYGAMDDGLNILWADKQGLLEETEPMQHIVFNIENVKAFVGKYEAEVEQYTAELQSAEKQHAEFIKHGKEVAIKRLNAMGERSDYVDLF